MARQGLSKYGTLLQICNLSNEDDLINARAAVKMHAKDMEFSIVNQTKIVTAASELGRNVLEHGSGGRLTIFNISNEVSAGICLVFEDNGPGIENLELAMSDGFSSKKGMGLGLSGSKRLMDEFQISSQVGKGTTVIVKKWK